MEKRKFNLPTQYINSLRVLGRSSNTIISYKSTILSLIRFLADNEEMQMAEIFDINDNDNTINELIKTVNDDTVESYKAYLIKDHEASGANTKIVILKAFYAWLQDRKHIEENYFETERFSVPNRKPMAMNTEEAEKFLTTVATGDSDKDIRDFVIMNLVINTGLRINETLSLTPMMIKRSGNLRYLDIMGKGRKQREITLTDNVFDMLKDYIEQNDIKKDEKIFTITARTVERNMKNYLNKAKMDSKYTPHKLRHTYATMMYGAGVPVEQISEYLGHESINTTMNFYVQTSEDQRKKASESHPLNGKIFR